MNTAGAPPRIRGASKARGDGRKKYVPDAFGSRLGRAGRLSEMRHGAGAGKSVGQCNDIITDYTIKMLAALPGKPKVLAVGERVHARLADAGLNPIGLFTVPNSVQAITPQRLIVAGFLIDLIERIRMYRKRTNIVAAKS